jgi:potassium efflux system protein
VGEGLTRSVFGSGEVIAFGKRVFLLLPPVELVRKVLPPGFLKLMGRYVLLPSWRCMRWGSGRRHRTA